MKLGSGARVGKRKTKLFRTGPKMKPLGAQHGKRSQVRTKHALTIGLVSLLIIVTPAFFVRHGAGVSDESIKRPATQSQTSTQVSVPSSAHTLLDDSNVSGFSYDDVDFSSTENSSFLSDLDSSDGTMCDSSCTVYNRQGESIRIHCLSSGSCTTYSSSGETYNTFCYSSSSCSTYGSDGSHASTYCYSSSSCSTYDSDGNTSNTYCYSSSSCSTYDSDGDYSHTYCYSSSSCSSYGSDGSYSHTYCYTSSCNTYGSDGSNYTTYGY